MRELPEIFRSTVLKDQRPLERKHIEEIAEHVEAQGLLPTSVIVGTKTKDKLMIES